MITKNITGSNISQSFIDQIRSDSPDVTARLMLNGVEVSCDIVSIHISKGAVGGEVFNVGDVVATKLTAIVKNLATDLKGLEIECQVGAWTGSYEYISVCKATVSDVKATRYQTKIVAYSSVVSDTVGAFDVSSLPSNPTISDIADIVEADTGRSITFDTGIDTTKIVMHPLNGLSDYQVLQVIAVCSGGFIINSNDNDIRVCRFSTTPSVSVDTGMMVNLPEVDNTFEVTGIYCLVQEESTDDDGNDIPPIEYSVGTVNYSFTSEYITNSIFTANIANLTGYEYTPAEIGLTLGDPRLEGCDVVSVTDVDGTVYTVPCHQITHRYEGGLKSDIQSVQGSDESNDVATVAPISSRLSNISKTVVRAENTAQNAQTIARNNAQYFWFLESDTSGVGTGAHITEIPKETFVSNPAGGNLLARSNGIAVRDGLTELAIFGASGARIGVATGSHSVIDTDGQRFYARDGVLELANIGYGQGASEQGTQANAPYFTFGAREENTQESGIGNYSFAEGRLVIASEYASHAEGDMTLSSGRASHAEGMGTEARGDRSHAEGVNAVASGTEAHAQNTATIAGKHSQTAIGTYNEEDTSTTTTHPSMVTSYGQYALIIGNGTADDARSNAFMVDWVGDIYPRGVRMANHVTESGTASGWTYRKWSGGKIEAWYRGDVTCQATASASPVYRSDFTLSIPSAIGFGSAPNVITSICNRTANVFSIQGYASTATNINGRCFRTSSTTTTFTLAVAVYVWGS